MSFLSNLFSRLFGGKPKRPNFPEPAKDARVLRLTRDNHVIKTAEDLEALAKKLPGSRVNGRTWDLGGGILSGKDLRGSGNQSENQDPLLRIELGRVVIRNGFCRDVKDGLHIAAPEVQLRDMHWLDVGEDAVNNRQGAYNTKLVKCSFDTSKPGNDKTIQLNEGRDAEVVDCLIYGGITGIRLGDKWSNSKDRAKVKNVQFVGCETAMNLAKIGVEVKGCTYTGVRKQVVHSHGSQLV